MNTRRPRKSGRQDGAAGGNALAPVRDEQFMRRAIALAVQYEGLVEPNPMVGCVLVRNGRIIAEGAHERFGGPHAEVLALRAAGANARGATAYVNLEPCAHYGKTPPCADALIRAGVRRVVAAMRDPFSEVQGRGFEKLRTAGIAVDVGVLAEAAATLNGSFLKRVLQRRPWVILKWAQSLDGKIATRSGDSRWISDETCRTDAHAVRGRVDAIVVGVETVLRDNPALTCRHVQPRRIARRVVLDTHLRTPPDSVLGSTAREIETWVMCGDWMRRSAAAVRLARRGVRIVPVAAEPAADRITGRAGRRGRRLDVAEVLDRLYEAQATNVLVEGGGRVLAAFHERQLADEIHVYIAPLLIGGERAPGPLRGTGPRLVSEALRLPAGYPMRALGDGWLLRARLWQPPTDILDAAAGPPLAQRVRSK